MSLPNPPSPSPPKKVTLGPSQNDGSAHAGFGNDGVPDDTELNASVTLPIVLNKLGTGMAPDPIFCFLTLPTHFDLFWLQSNNPPIEVNMSAELNRASCTLKDPGKMLLNPLKGPAKSDEIWFDISFNKPPVNCSATQSPATIESAKNFPNNPCIVEDNPDWILPGKQSKPDCKFFKGPTIAFCAAIAANSDPVAANVVAYKDCNPDDKPGIIFEYILPIILFTNPFDIVSILWVAEAISVNKFVVVEIFEDKFVNTLDILLKILSSHVSAAISTNPKPLDALISSPVVFLKNGDFKEFLFDSFDSPLSNVPSPVGTFFENAVDGANPSSGSGASCETSFVLPSAPIITGTCALLPSIKNPMTESPGRYFTLWPLFAAPVPAVAGRRAIAHGKSASFNSLLPRGWYPIILTLNLFPHPSPVTCFPWDSIGAILPTHQVNPSWPIKLVLKNESCNILSPESIPS